MRKKSFNKDLLSKPHAIIQSVVRLANSDIITQSEYAIIVRKGDVYKSLMSSIYLRNQVMVVDIPAKDMWEIDLSNYKPVLITNDGTVYEQKNLNFRNLLSKSNI